MFVRPISLLQIGKNINEGFSENHQHESILDDSNGTLDASDVNAALPGGDVYADGSANYAAVASEPAHSEQLIQLSQESLLATGLTDELLGDAMSLEDALEQVSFSFLVVNVTSNHPCVLLCE